MLKRQLVFFAFAIAALTHAVGALAFDFHGFQIDESARQLAPDARASLQAQLDIVDAVGLPAEVVAALKATPIVVDPALRGNPGIFAVRGGSGAVVVQPVVFASH